MTCTYLARCHHHTTTDGVKRIRADTGTSGDSPAESERGKEVTLQRPNQENRLDGIVHSEVKTTVDDDTRDGRPESTVKTTNTVSSEGLLVNIDETVKLASTASLSAFRIVGKTSTCVIKGIDEKEGSGTSSLFILSMLALPSADRYLPRRRPNYPSSTSHIHHGPS